MDSEKQKDEITALESIYSSEEFSYCNDNGHYECSFMIFINLPLHYHVIYKDIRHVEPKQKIQISYLPPLTLNILLPESYPSELPPEFCLQSSWLDISQLSILCSKLDQLWEESKGQEILFTWVAFLQHETLGFLHIQKSYNMSIEYTCYKEMLEQDYKNMGKVEVNSQHTSSKILIQDCHDKRAVLHCPVKINPIQALVDYNDTQLQIQFKKNFYTCKICFIDQLGEHSTQFLPCHHIYCKDCISSYLEVRIKDGNVQNICCPEEKCTSEATHSQIKGLISSELFVKYDSILLSTAIDTMDNITYCPRRICQYPVICEPNEQVANCPNCLYAFCIFCKMSYHGIEPCKADMHELITKYQHSSEEEKKQLERVYGKVRLQTLVGNVKSENWIKTHSKKCPKCRTAIEKNHGCNNMQCWKCNTCFCWLCSTILDPKHGYNHFVDPASKCNAKLFSKEDEDDDDYLGDYF